MRPTPHHSPMSSEPGNRPGADAGGRMRRSRRTRAWAAALLSGVMATGALYATMYHWGAIVVAPGYTDPRVFAAGGNPYGASSTDAPTQEEIDGARHLGERVASIAARLGAPVSQ